MRSILQVSAAAFEEIKKRLELCGLNEVFLKTYRDDDHPEQLLEILDFGEVALRRETDERLTVFIAYEGKIIKHGDGSTDGAT